MLTFRGLIIQCKKIKTIAITVKELSERKKISKVERVWLPREHIFCFRSHTGEDPLLCSTPPLPISNKDIFLSGPNVQANSHQDREFLGRIRSYVVQGFKPTLTLCSEIKPTPCIVFRKQLTSDMGKTYFLNYAPLSRQVAAFLFIFLSREA